MEMCGREKSQTRGFLDQLATEITRTDLVSGELDEDIRLSHLSVSVMSASKIADIFLGIEVHGLINRLEKQAAIRLGVIEGFAHRRVFLSLGEPFSRLGLHDNPIPARNVILVGMQFADLCRARAQSKF